MTRERTLDYLRDILELLDDRKLRLVYSFALHLTGGTARQPQEEKEASSTE